MGRTYTPDGEELERYLDSRANVVCIQGPVRSGKSVAVSYTHLTLPTTPYV